MRRLLLILSSTALVATACGGDGPTPGGAAPLAQPESAVVLTTTTQPSSPAPTSSPTAPASTDAPTAPSPTDAPAPPSTTTSMPPPPPAAVGDPVVASELVAELDQPIDLAVRPGDARLYVVEQGGRIVRVDPSSGDRATVLTVGDISGANEQGLLGLEFSRDGSLAYTNRTDAGGTTVISEYAVAADGTIDAGSERELLRVAQPYTNHNAGDLEIGPDGMLYVPLGDGGSGGDPQRFADDPTSLLGSLLRIDPTPSADLPYSIPPDNPFADGVNGAPEVWSIGLRNPWKIAFDPPTGDLWIADVGQNRFEEVNRVSPTGDLAAGWGVNFGWSALEGSEAFNTDVAAEGTTLPVLTYSHDDGCSISGGVVYRGTAIAELEPAYVYSDFCNGTIWALDLAQGRVLPVLDGFDQVTAVRTGPDGEIYVVERSGGVHRLVPG